MTKVKIEFDPDKKSYLTAQDMFMLIAVLKELEESYTESIRVGVARHEGMEDELIPWTRHVSKVLHAWINEGAQLHRRGFEYANR